MTGLLRLHRITLEEQPIASTLASAGGIEENQGKAAIDDHTRQQ
jgi:hypothetical protein